MLHSGRLLALCILCCVLPIHACREEKSTPGRSTDTNSDTEHSLIEDYLVLVESLSFPLYASPAQPPTPDEATLRALLQMKSLTLENLAKRTRSPEVKHIATQGFQALQNIDLFVANQGYAEMDFAGAALETAIGLGFAFSGSTDLLESGSRAMLESGGAARANYQRFNKSIDQYRAAQIMVVGLAAKLRSTASLEMVPRLDFDEPPFAGQGNHVLRLDNTTGQRLTNCAIVVEIVSQDGRLTNHVHFAREWPREDPVFALYDPSLGWSFHGVKAVTAFVLSDQGVVGPIAYEYQGVEHNKDIERHLQATQFDIRYLGDSLWTDGRSIELTLRGIDRLPMHTLSVRFRHGSQIQDIQWELEGWNRGARQRLDGGKLLGFDPESVEVGIYLHDSGVSWKSGVCRLK